MFSRYFVVILVQDPFQGKSVFDIGTRFHCVRTLRVAVKSSRSNAEFPDMSDALKFAVSQGRFVQDPLLEMAYMWQMKGTVGSAQHISRFKL